MLRQRVCKGLSERVIGCGWLLVDTRCERGRGVRPLNHLIHASGVRHVMCVCVCVVVECMCRMYVYVRAGEKMWRVEMRQPQRQAGSVAERGARPGLEMYTNTP